MSDLLPIANGPDLRAEARRLGRRHRKALAGTVCLHAAAAAAGLAGPPLLGKIVQSLQEGTTRRHIDTLVLILAAALFVQTIVTFGARLASFVLSEKMFAELREDFMLRVLALPLSTVERAGTGDLVSRTTADVDALARTVRFAIPETLIAAVTTILTVAAAVWVSPIAALPCITGVPLLLVGTRWYLHRAPAGYLWERASYATLAGTVSETVEGGRTVEALSLREERVGRIDSDLDNSYRAERRTLFLRTMWFPSAEFAYVLPVAASLAWGGWLVSSGRASIGQVTAVALFVVKLADPVDRLISWLDEIQVGLTSFARLVGIARVPPDRYATDDEPEGDRLRAEGVRYAYVADRDVLHGIDLDLEPGERVAVVGPSGAGKSTLGRLLAGIHPPRVGLVEVGGVRLVDLPLDTLRTEVALVTQEQHVFVGTLADNLRLARPRASDAQLTEAFTAVDAIEWVEALPDGLETVVGAGGYPLTPPQAQQVALARLVLADPHTLVLDEATSLLDPRAARHLERSLASVLDGRTVVAIAHRLHTAHDADRVAVVEDGLLNELGTHAELVANRGPYAALWDSWHGDR
ncbi:MAG TPA: ABC transporter ATP-binding protein [Gaiellaceae bacterium]|nr:ABC transporter ATP-binding protein [Gaiellaceae bacterium]